MNAEQTAQEGTPPMQRREDGRCQSSKVSRAAALAQIRLTSQRNEASGHVGPVKPHKRHLCRFERWALMSSCDIISKRSPSSIISGGLPSKTSTLAKQVGAAAVFPLRRAPELTKHAGDDVAGSASSHPHGGVKSPEDPDKSFGTGIQSETSSAQKHKSDGSTPNWEKEPARVGAHQAGRR